MIPRFDRPEDLPGQAPVTWRGTRAATIGAVVAAALWPPLLLTLPIWPPHNWMPGIETDWRLVLMLIGLIATPLGLRQLMRERARTGRPGTRLGVIWRFTLYGGLLAAALQVVVTVGVVVVNAVKSGSVMQALGSTETSLLVFGVGGLAVAILVGVSYALWAGVCVAFIGFRPAPEVKDRLGLMRN